jgi:hypothetical protein
MQTSTITLKGQEYKAKLDFTTLGRVQAALKKQGTKVGFQEIFNEIQEQNFEVITELIIQSILRVHPQIKRAVIEEKLDLGELENAFTFMATLIEDALPKGDKKK